MFKLAVNVVSVCLQVKMTKNLTSNRQFIIWQVTSLVDGLPFLDYYKTDLIFERFELLKRI